MMTSNDDELELKLVDDDLRAADLGSVSGVSVWNANDILDFAKYVDVNS